MLLAAAACTQGSPPDGKQDGSSGMPARSAMDFMVRRACGLPEDVLLRIRNGYDPRRSGQVMLVQHPEDVVASRFAHSGPWDHFARVPLFLYGPGHVPALGSVGSRATVADLAPTLARHLDFPMRTEDGRALGRAVEPDGPPPRVVVVVVWDGGGRNVLDAHPGAWPTLRGLIPVGAWFERAEIGSSPSITGPVHASIGTGTLPRTHGRVAHEMRLGADLAYSNDVAPGDLRVPALADLWDRARDNRPVVGVVAFLEWHLGMLGHGSAFPGGDRDLAVLFDEDTQTWNLSRHDRRHFAFPDWGASISGRKRHLRELDLEDGQLDGRWLGESLALPGLAERTPAYARWQTEVLARMIDEEGFGTDPVPDLLFTNYKVIDAAGHRWSNDSPQMDAAVRASDDALADIVDLLDREVGPGRWLLALTADHGVSPVPTDDFIVDTGELADDVEARFDPEDAGRLAQVTAPSQMWLDPALLEDLGVTVEEVAAYVARYRKGQNVADPSAIPTDGRDRLFAAAFPGSLLNDLPCLG